MAKKDKADKAPKADTEGDKAEKREAAPEFKFGVSDLAEKLGIKEASVRVQLRNKGIEKAGKSYGWNSKADLDAVASQLKSKDEAGEEKADKNEKKSKKDKGGDADAKTEKKAKKDKKDKKKDK